MFVIFEDCATGTITTLYLEGDERPFDLTLLVRSEMLSSFYSFLENLAYREPNNPEIEKLRRAIAIEQFIGMEDVIYMGGGKTIMFNQRREKEYLRKRLKMTKRIFGKHCQEYRDTQSYYRENYLWAPL